MLISHTFQRKRYISIASTGNFIMHALGPFSRKRSHVMEEAGDVYRCMIRKVWHVRGYHVHHA